MADGKIGRWSPVTLFSLSLQAWLKAINNSESEAEWMYQVIRAPPRFVEQHAESEIAYSLFHLAHGLNGFGVGSGPDGFYIPELYKYVSRFVEGDDREARAKLVEAFPFLLDEEHRALECESRHVQIVIKHLHVIWTWLLQVADLLPRGCNET
jgi:hypothetical protein